MSAQVEIRDGVPQWYLSPDIWVVPGADPAGPPGAPVAGEPAYVWARIDNRGDSDVRGVRVDFWWADPTFQVTRTNAHLIGTAFGDALVGGGPQEVLCLVPWLPVIVNNGHECLVATATYPGDSVPTPPPDAFDPPSYPEVAQKNLTVLAMSSAMMVKALTVAGFQRVDGLFTLAVSVGGKLDEPLLAGLGLQDARPARQPSVRAGLRLEAGCPRDDAPALEKLELHVPAGRNGAVYLTLSGRSPAKGEYQLVTVEQRWGDNRTVLGGIAFVVVGSGE